MSLLGSLPNFIKAQIDLLLVIPSQSVNETSEERTIGERKENGSPCKKETKTIK